jgi:hypothetical protein
MIDGDRSMKKVALLFLALGFCVSFLAAKAPTKPTNFSGTWTLDTHRTKKVPDGLESYSMVVTQNPQQLRVQTTLKGDLRPSPGLNQQYPQSRQGTGYPGRYPGRMGGGMGRMGGMGMPGGNAGPMGEGMPAGTGPGGGTGGSPRNTQHARSAALAFTVYPQNAVYKLDGTESTAKLGGSLPSDAAAKAAWAKGNKQLKLRLTGTGNSDAEGAVEVQEQWKLSKDGQQLFVDRTVHSPNGSASIHLVFDKQHAAA